MAFKFKKIKIIPDEMPLFLPYTDKLRYATSDWSCGGRSYFVVGFQAYLISTLEACFMRFRSFLHLGDEDATASLDTTKDGEVENLLPGGPCEDYCPGLGLGGTSDV